MTDLRRSFSYLSHLSLLLPKTYDSENSQVKALSLEAINYPLNQWLSSFGSFSQGKQSCRMAVVCVQAASADLWILLCQAFSGEEPFYITLIAGTKLNMLG